MGEPTKAQIMASQLKQYQAMPLGAKVRMSITRIEQWLDHWEDQCYVAFSGGKDSTVLLDLVWKVNPRIPAVFVDTGLEYPEIREFVKSYGDRVVWLKPKMPFNEVIEKYGYPVVSKEVSQKIHEVRTTKSDKLRHKRLHGADNAYKSGKIPSKWQRLIPADFKISHKCCDIMKKHPCKQYEKATGRKPFVGMMASDSHARKQIYVRSGCSSFERKIQSRPLAFWLEEDVWEYIKETDLNYCSVYDNGCDRTGCMFCMFGVHMEQGENRFQRMRRTHPKQWNYCINKLGCGKVLDYIGVDPGPDFL